jgi:hypothetical protein
MHVNPYATPEVGNTLSMPSWRMWLGYLATVFVASVVGGVLGAGAGGLLGIFTPGYYRAVFSGGADPLFDPVAVGIGLGTVQGMGLGTVVGVIVVALVIWQRTRVLTSTERSM